MQDFNLEGQHSQSGILKIGRPWDGEQTGGVSLCEASTKVVTSGYTPKGGGEERKGKQRNNVEVKSARTW